MESEPNDQRNYKLQTDDRWIIYQCTLIVALFLFQLTADTQPTLVLNAGGQPPLNTKTHDGFMDEVAREALKRIGYELVIDHLPAERSLRNANSGLIDGEMGRIKGIDNIYHNLIRVPEKIMDWEFFVFSKKPVNLQQGWASLANKNLAFITGWKILEKNIPKTAAIIRAKMHSAEGRATAGEFTPKTNTFRATPISSTPKGYAFTINMVRRLLFSSSVIAKLFQFEFRSFCLLIL